MRRDRETQLRPIQRSVHRGVADGCSPTVASRASSTRWRRRTSDGAGRIEDALIEVEALPEQDLLKYLAAIHQSGSSRPSGSPKPTSIARRSTRCPKLAERLNIVPVLFDASTNTLSVVTADPQNVDALDQVQKGARVREVKPLVARPAAVRPRSPSSIATSLSLLRARDQEPGLDKSTCGAFGSPGFAPTAGGRDVGILFDGGDCGGGNAGAPRSARPCPAASAGLTFSLGGPSAAKAAAEKKRISMPTMAIPEESWGTSQVYIETLNVLITLLENSREGAPRALGPGGAPHRARWANESASAAGRAQRHRRRGLPARSRQDVDLPPDRAQRRRSTKSPRAAAEKSYATPARLMSSAKLAPATVAAIEGMYERYDGNGFPEPGRGQGDLARRAAPRDRRHATST